MGYPMTYWRVLWRSDLVGEYDRNSDGKGLLRGDLRRLEKDQRDEHHLAKYAAAADITPAQAKIVLDYFLDGEVWERSQRKTVEHERLALREDGQ